MLHRLAALAFVALLAGQVVAAPELSADRLLEHIKFLASDELKGRDSGSEGLQRAGEYVREKFAEAGLQPGWQGAWVQPFDVNLGLSVGKGNSLVIAGPGKSVTLNLAESYFPMSASANENAALPSNELSQVPLVFAGYGLVVPRLGYDDYAGVDVRGKAVLIYSHEPQEHDSNSPFNGTRPVSETTLNAKASQARRHGAVALLVVTDPTHRTDDVNYRLFAFDPQAESLGIPVLRVHREDVQPLLVQWDLETTVRQIDRDLKPRSRLLDGASISYREHLTRHRATVGNIVGILPGSDPALAGEAIVIGAHYDHVGLGGNNSAAPDRTGEIHNGADDNASGTAAIIEIAREAAQARQRFPRTLVFVAFAAEERGLLGSEYYVRNPAVPIDRTIAMLNLDMVGRSRGSVDVSGMETGPSLEPQLKLASEAVPGLRILRQGPGAGRSDDASFLNRRVPAINFFTGFHNDYHRPSDDWERIDADGTRRVAMLAFEFAARIAARPTRPEFVAPR